MTSCSGAVGDLEADLVSGRPLADVLRKVVILAGQVGSVELRDWATWELRGYSGIDASDLPPYRQILAPILLDGISRGGMVQRQPLPYAALPDFVRESMAEELPVRQGVAELEAWSRQSEGIKLGLPGWEIIAELMTSESGDPHQRILAIYWSMEPVVAVGILDDIRTQVTARLTELVPATSSPGPDDSMAEEKDVAVVVADNSQVAPTRWQRWRVVGAVIVGVATVIGSVAAVLALVW